MAKDVLGLNKRLNSKSNEWYTPPEFIRLVRLTFDDCIDLDPASCEEANAIVGASRYYTKEENGLRLPWYGNVYLNPPYSNVTESQKGMLGRSFQGPTALFIRKLQVEYRLGNVNQAIACLNADIVRPWFRSLWNYPICFPYDPVRFIRDNGATDHHFFPTCFVYMGENDEKFRRIWSPIGTIVKKW